MAISNYSELLTAVASWMARSDLTARIPEFIALAEAKFNRNLFVPQMEQRSTASVDSSSDDPEFISLPSDFQTMRSVRLNGVTGKPRLQFMSKTQIDDYRYCRDDVSGRPIYFAVVGADMELAPTPNENYELEMVYRKNLTPLSASNTSNWLLASAPDLYLYGALNEAAVFMEQDDRIPLWQANLKSAVDAINILGERQEYAPSPASISLPGVTP
jgi:hypothetical protein